MNVAATRINLSLLPVHVVDVLGQLLGGRKLFPARPAQRVVRMLVAFWRHELQWLSSNKKATVPYTQT
jgi:hypothetical protein